MKKTLSVVLALLMVLSGAAYAAPATVDTVGTTNETEIDIEETQEAVIAQETATLAAEGYNVPDGSKLVFDVSFNNGTAISNYKTVTTYGTYGTDFVDENNLISDIVTGTNGNNKIYIDWANVTAAEYASVTSNAYSTDDALALSNKITVAEGKTSVEAYPLLYFRAGDGTNNAFAEGRYTLFAKVKVAGNTGLESVKYGPLIHNGKDVGMATSAYQTYFDLNMAENIMQIDVFIYGGKMYTYGTDGKLKQAATLTSGSLSKFGAIIVPKATASTTSYVYIDDIQMYYQPLECTPGTYVVNFNAGGKTVSDLPAKKVGITALDLQSIKLSDVGTSRFVGWSTSPEGKVVTSLTLTENTTLYAIWDDYFYAPDGEGANDELVFDAHFNYTYTTFGNKNANDSNIATAGSAYSKVASGGITFGAGNSRANYELKDISNADDELVLTTSGTSASETWPALWLNGSFADGVYTLYAEVSVSADKELDYIKYNPAISGKKSGTNTTRSGSKFDLNTDGTKQYITVTVTSYNGNIYYGTSFGKDSVVLDASTVYRMGINFNVKAKTAETTKTCIFVDNVRMYYRPLHKALTYTENSIRVDSPAGLRFKSSVNSLTRSDANLTEYGYIVTRKAILDGAGVSADDFTLDSTFAYVKGVSYGMSDGKKVDRVFDTEGVNTIFTAVVYNIPSTMYQDVIVVRPYVKVGETVTYGDPMSASIYEVAQKLDGNTKFQEAVDKILNGEEI